MADKPLSQAELRRLAWQDTGTLGGGMVNASIGVLGVLTALYVSELYGYSWTPILATAAQIAGVVFVALAVVKIRDSRHEAQVAAERAALLRTLNEDWSSTQSVAGD